MKLPTRGGRLSTISDAIAGYVRPEDSLSQRAIFAKADPLSS